MKITPKEIKEEIIATVDKAILNHDNVKNKRRQAIKDNKLQADSTLHSDAPLYKRIIDRVKQTKLEPRLPKPIYNDGGYFK